jgi:hypothetical protein
MEQKNFVKLMSQNSISDRAQDQKYSLALSASTKKTPFPFLSHDPPKSGGQIVFFTVLFFISELHDKLARTRLYFASLRY